MTGAVAVADGVKPKSKALVSGFPILVAPRVTGPLANTVQAQGSSQCLLYGRRSELKQVAHRDTKLLTGQGPHFSKEQQGPRLQHTLSYADETTTVADAHSCVSTNWVLSESLRI